MARAEQTLIGYATEPYSWPEWLAAAGVPDLKPAGLLKFEQMYFALQAASEGLGVVLVPLFLAMDDMIAGNLCTPFGLRHARQRHYFASSTRSGPVVDSFYEWLTREGRDTEQSMAKWIDTQESCSVASAGPKLSPAVAVRTPQSARA